GCTSRRSTRRRARSPPPAADLSWRLSCEARVGGRIDRFLPHRAEHVEFERVFERLSLMFGMRGYVEHLALAYRDLGAADEELERALEHVCHLLALMSVHRDDAATLQIHLDD